MSNDRRLLARMRELCAELGPDDGLTSHEIEKTHRPPSARRRLDRLAGQIARVVTLALASSRDPLLQPLWIRRCEPFPDHTRFRLWVGLDGPVPPEEVADALARLEAARGWLRSEVATAIPRKRVPELLFAYAPEDPGSMP
ncbi:MAG: hypothetical protein KTR31_11135 [Myxococcales bacterium]|nr:hypothetical protein [Myxococcales bacterium]